MNWASKCRRTSNLRSQSITGQDERVAEIYLTTSTHAKVSTLPSAVVIIVE